MLQKIHYLTLFPQVIQQGLDHSLIAKAQASGKVSLHFVQIRDFAKDKHKTVDDVVYGGGAGMLIKAPVLVDAWSSVSSFEKKNQPVGQRPFTILLSPQGKLLTQEHAKNLVQNHPEIIFVCGHYEGVDERFIDLCVDEELSIGDYVLTGGELPAMVASDVLIRLIPGTVGNEDSVTGDSLEDGLLKAPQFTRPREFMGHDVPDVLLSGNHQAIADWRKKQSIERTRRKRPDLYAKKMGKENE
jgi:tRNA (guanine37-N1)-methyltransferase